jgi:hypothetical protein
VLASSGAWQTSGGLEWNIYPEGHITKGAKSIVLDYGRNTTSRSAAGPDDGNGHYSEASQCDHSSFAGSFPISLG